MPAAKSLELRNISTTPYLDKLCVLPRDGAWMTEQNLNTEADAIDQLEG